MDSVENWREVGLFKVKAYEDEAKQIIFENTEYSASQTLLRFIVEDIKKELDQLKKTGDGLVKITDYKNQDNKDKIKAYLDSIKKVLSIIQYFSVNESKIKNGGTLDPIIVEALKDIIFEPILENYEINWFKWYDAVRNYLTKKPQDDVKENKLKLNFESSSLLEGWADSPEGNTQYKAFLLKNGEKYLLGITNKPKIFDKQLHPNAFVENSEWKKMIYKQLDGKTIYGSTYKGEFDKKYLDNESVNQKDLIQNVKKMLQNKITIFPELKELLNKEYNLAKELAADIANLTMYYTGFENISKEYLEQIQKEGNLYLLEIYSKDLYSIKKTGKDLQVIYFNNLFSENNLNNLVYKLNGKGEIFYRKIGLKERNIKKGYENKPWVIKGKRFTDSSTKDSKGKQFFFHFPITINAKKISGVRDGRPNGNAIKKVNEIFLNYLESESENLYYLGIDRGEKHLAYYCLVNSKGEIISQGSLNLPLSIKTENHVQ
ncbi:MAG: hypothetical protein HC932_06310 [Thermales bacterium]|nr:hypothetical protein [Thermales bacterium]